MLKYINKNITDNLKTSLSLSITKKDHNERTSSVAISDQGAFYYSGIVESDTNTFNISSEQVALTLSTMSNDYKVSKIITMVESPNLNSLVSPIILKIIKDHSIRIGLNIEYTIIDTKLNILFETKNINTLIPFYKPEQIILSRINQKTIEYVDNIRDTENTKEILKKYAIKGLDKNFPLYDSASGYATAVLTKSKKVFFSGQYSSPDKRLGLHSEVNAILGALMNKETEITHLGLVSTKYKDSPCNMCGNCRQFLYEMSNKYNFSPRIFLFAKDNEEFIEYDINNYLPNAWTSKKWI